MLKRTYKELFIMIIIIVLTTTLVVGVFKDIPKVSLVVDFLRVFMEHIGGVLY